MWCGYNNLYSPEKGIIFQEFVQTIWVESSGRNSFQLHYRLFVNRNADILFEKMIEKGFYIMPGGTPGYFRVSHLGIQDEESLSELARTIHQIELL